MADDLLQAIALARAGKKEQALPILQRVLQENPKNELAWLWLADCLPTLELRIQALETFVHESPEAKRAQAGLAALRKQEQLSSQVVDAPRQPQSPAFQPPAVPQGTDLPVYHSPVAPFRAGSEPIQPPTDTGEVETEKEDFADVIFKVDNIDWDAAEETPGPAPFVLDFDLPTAQESAPYRPTEIPPADPAQTGAQVFTTQDETDEGSGLRQKIEAETWTQGDPGAAGFGPSFDAAGYDIDLEDISVEKKAGQPPQPPRVDAFTVPIDEVTQDEFQQIEERTEATLQRKPVIRPLKAQQNRQAPAPARSRRPQPKRKTNPTRVVIFLIITIIGLIGMATLLVGLILSRSGF